MAGVLPVIEGGSEADYFRAHGWTEQIALRLLTKSQLARSAFFARRAAGARRETA
jgi:hypothetical protein